MLPCTTRYSQVDRSDFSFFTWMQLKATQATQAAQATQLNSTQRTNNMQLNNTPFRNLIHYFQMSERTHVPRRPC